MRRTKRGWLLLPALAVFALAGAACGDGAATTPGGTSAAAAAKGDITVFAAASLSAPFEEIGAAFTARYPGARATFSFDASSALVQQIIQGAPADVFASADAANMEKLTAARLEGSEPVVFATNRLEIIVGAGNPEGISGLADLSRPGLTVVLCAPEVPCGRYASESLEAAGVAVTPASLEQNVKGVVTKVTAGEADAGIVYATDVLAAGDDAAGVEIPAAVNVAARYPIATVASSEEADVATAFLAFVTGAEGRRILATYGFGAP